ncbi:MAG: aminopeptidase P family protein [Hyphomicrobium sp.]|uniref:aminopeptidase P family protein n=1 Tax=Hyphomicrobium sp. TaxID=82 RepID=UPI0013220B46|nr:aminopeptidase P family protein [Hyphomicrobium sp.]KAB2941855.1 MAG: aminopeptidase P family protein [Hyphomicrobium sp.]MBZ0211694.1 aminopeptidase P family protein [Hyphomicrobium sp.]
MFQTFESQAERGAAQERLKELRRLMAAAKLDAYLIPRADEHQGEYVPASAARLKFLTGFSGSAGLAIVTKKTASLFVDGRYTVQARSEVEPGLIEVSTLARTKIGEWLGERLSRGQRVGFDPRLHTVAEIERLEAALKPHAIKLVPTNRNLVDRIWGRARPPAPKDPVSLHPLKLAGRSPQDKIADIQKLLKAEKQDAVILTLSDSVAWTFNIRGSDIPHTPVALAFAILPAAGKPELFLASEKLEPAVRAHLETFAKISPPETLAVRLKALRAAGKRVRLDPNTAGYWFARALGGEKRIARGPDPSLALKAVKNATEIKGARAAHLRDGVAVTRFLAWLDAAAATGALDEIEAVRRLEGFRRATNQLREISFDTISGSGPNGAIVHYRVSDATNRKLRGGELFLIDSGAQYLDGTTDITRTVAIGKPTNEMRERFTLVLKGHIAIASARFPKGTRGIDLDPFARRALWQHGLDYDHGTGHGVGSYLSVHEGPQSISRAGMAVLEPGMICSNEPGYYKEGAYGIRIENLVLVTEPEKLPGADRETMGFETLTLAPIDRRLIVSELLTAGEIAWLDAYHARVAAALSPEVDEETRAWLKAATAPL